MRIAIQSSDLTRRYANGSGVVGLDLCVPESSIYAFLGPNGAGKTTTIRLLLGLLQAERGRVEIFGRPASLTARTQVAALVESPSLYLHLSGQDNLEVTRRLLGLPASAVDRALRRVDLQSAATRKVREYSLGMRQRLALALALLGQPRLLILDEPSNGLDPPGILALRALIRSLCQDEGLSVFLSSHLLSEVDQLATHVGVLQQGRLRFQGPLSELRARIVPHLRLSATPMEQVIQELSAMGIEWTHVDAGLRLSPSAWSSAEINARLVRAGIQVHAIAPESISLEDLYFDLTETQHASL